MTSLEQQRAAHALAAVQALTDDADVDRASYRSYVDRLGPAILMNGLGQALATERAAADAGDRGPDKQAHRQLYEHVHRWLCRSDGGVYRGAEDLLRALVDGDQDTYVRAQAEALAWLSWHKKFCHAELPRRADRSEDGDE